MENSHSFSYPNSQASTPRSLPVDADADDPAAAGGGGGGHKVKFICSYGGKIQPRAHDNRLSYVGGDTKILAVERNVRFPALLARLAAVSGAVEEFSVKYPLPGEDLDALISVTNDEDLDHLMAEYDRVSRASPKPARMRLVLFPATPPAVEPPPPARPDSKWLVDALNAAPIQAAMESATAEDGNGRDFLFGFDKGYPPPPPQPPAAVTTAAAEVGTPVRSDSGTPPPPPPEIERQIEEMKRMPIGGGHEYYAQQPPPAIAADPRSVYLVHPRAPPPARVYSGMQPVTGQMGQGYYVVQQQPPPPPPEIYQRESAAVYGMPAVGPARMAYAAEGGANMVRAAVPELVYGQIAYDGAGRPFYFASSAPATAIVAPGGATGAYTTAPASAVEVRPPAVELKLGKSAAQAS